MKWFKRRVKKPIEHNLNVFHSELHVTHTIEKKPDPQPTMGWMIFTNNVGQQWHAPPFNINGRQGMRVYMDKSWITGNNDDCGQQISFQLNLEY